MIIAGVNGGGTKTEAICCNERGEIIAKGTSGPSNYHNIGMPNAIANIKSALSDSGFPRPDMLCVALAAINTEKDRLRLSRALSKVYKNAILEHDAFAELYSETRGSPGVIAIAGTGSVVLGYDGKKRYRLADMGWFLGDIGSGYFIGRQAIRLTASMIFEGRTRSKIAGCVLSQLGISDPEDLMSWVYSNRNTVSEIASLAIATEKAAKLGDANAIRIIRTASSNLASASIKIHRKVGTGTVYYKGGIFATKQYLSRFSEVLAKAGIRACAANTKPAYGALLIAADRAGVEVRPAAKIL